MSPLEAKFAELLVQCEKIMKPVSTPAFKLVIVSKTHQEWQPVQDNKRSISTSFVQVLEEIRNLKSFDIAKQSFQRDKVFSKATRIAGYWATFEAVLQYLISNATVMHKNSVVINHIEAIQQFRSFRKLLKSSHVEYKSTARLLGVNLRCKSLCLPDGVTLYRLNRQELNDRQSISQPYFSTVFDEQQLAYHPAELSVPITVPVDCSQEGALFKANNDAQEVAEKIFSKILNTILIVASGIARVRHIELEGGFEQLPRSLPVGRGLFPPANNIILGIVDLENIWIAYDLVSGGKKSDNTLSRALHRYILGRKRSDLVDKLVDYVIAWEAILLTQNGNPINQELSYRFALNGTSLLSTVCKDSTPEELFKKMKCAYSTRSSIVHGGDDDKRDSALKKGNFKSLKELCIFLEDGFRLVVFKISSMKPKERPYLKNGGWEALIWP